MRKRISKWLCLLLAVVLALSPMTGSAVAVYADDEGTTAETDLRITYSGDEVGYFKEDGVSSFGMLSPQKGSKVVVDGDQVRFYDVPSNKSVYDGLHWGFITDEDLIKDVLALPGGCWNITVSTDNCGYGIPVAPVKTEARGGGTTGSQYYLCIPAKEKLKTIADYSGVDAALASVPDDLSGYTEESAKAVTDAVAATTADDFRFYNIEEQAAVDAAAKAIHDAVAALEESKPETIELVPTNEELMFKVVNAYIEKMGART
ncbi:MAG: hypothetical protein IJ239_07455, partial [Eubacterium sp.]|nr:hypothetical protein [Eubacterium sp.]